MNEAQGVIRNVSDTAVWVATYRARETERPEALFRDPFARRLAGERGEQISATMSTVDRDTWSFAARTYLFDRFVEEQIEQGADMVVNLAAGLDARPYRMHLPPSLQWVEVDLPEILDYKQKILSGEKPACALEHVGLDLSDAGARRSLFEELGRRAGKALILSEGLLIYLAANEAASLAEDLARTSCFQRWAFDLQSPGLLRLAQKRLGKQLGRGGATLKFGPKEGPSFFEQHGWTPVDVRSMLKTAARFKRLPFLLRIMAMLPESDGSQGARFWSGVCLLKKTSRGAR
jgi:methyltransferase (TIGR00027 family)